MQVVHFCCDFLLLIDVIEWMSYECSLEGTYTQHFHDSPLVHIHQKKKSQQKLQRYTGLYKYRLPIGSFRDRALIILYHVLRHEYLLFIIVNRIGKLGNLMQT